MNYQIYIQITNSYATKCSICIFIRTFFLDNFGITNENLISFLSPAMLYSLYKEALPIIELFLYTE